MTHDQPLRLVWGLKTGRPAGPLRTHLRRLRSKLGEDASTPAYFSFAEARVGVDCQR